MDSTIFATILTLVVTFIGVPFYKISREKKYISKVTELYEREYIQPLIDIFPKNENDDIDLYREKLIKKIDKSIYALKYSRDNELKYLTKDYTFTLIRINAYTLDLMGRLKELLELYPFRNIEVVNPDNEIGFNREVKKKFVQLLNNYNDDVVRYYKFEIDRLSVDYSKINEEMKKASKRNSM